MPVSYDGEFAEHRRRLVHDLFDAGGVVVDRRGIAVVVHGGANRELLAVRVLHRERAQRVVAQLGRDYPSSTEDSAR